MNNYQKNKERIRNKAIEYSYSFSKGANYFYSELATYEDFFRKNGKKYGLLKEFKENGII